MYKHIKALILITLFSILLMGTHTVGAAQDNSQIVFSLKKKPRTVKKNIHAGEKHPILVKIGKKVIPVKKVSFKSSRPSVATITGGVISAHKKGITYITAKYGKRQVRIRLKVLKLQKVNNTLAPTNGVIISTEKDLLDWVDNRNTDYYPIYEEDTDKRSVMLSPQLTKRDEIVSYAKTFAGVLPYVYAGNSLVSGTDCSGFIHLIYAHFGINVPRTAREFQAMSNISASKLQPGDIVVYKYGGHVALYIGDGKVVHAKGRDYGTVIDNMNYGTPTGYVCAL